MLVLTLAPALALLLVLAITRLLKSKTPHPKLPPGSFGWPIIGESLEFLRSQHEGRPEKFIQDRMSKYNSPVFKTSVLGEPMVILCGPAGNKFLFSNEGKKVALWWPSSVRKLMGRCLVAKAGVEARLDKKLLMSFFNLEALMRSVGVIDEATKDHLRTHWEDKLLRWINNGAPIKKGKLNSVDKKLLMSFFNLEALMRSVGVIDEATKDHLRTHWEGKDQLEAYSTLKQHTFELACRLFMSITDPQLVSRLAEHFHVFLRGVIDLPINVPGTKFYRAKKAADSIRKELQVLVKQRRMELEKKTASPSQDLMSHLIANGDENGKLMPEVEIINNMLNLLFAGHDTSTSTLVLIIKYLSELPHVLEKFIAEQREIAASKAREELLQWEDLQKMRYSWNVISEVMRMSAPVIGSFRQALVDFTYEGYTIPKGWKGLTQQRSKPDQDVNGAPATTMAADTSACHSAKPMAVERHHRRSPSLRRLKLEPIP
ncbi:hypothetical protein NL676_018585 [Syzygium grande]|nr:hypothetical protein NL676_018585 [Syzygium grande]